MSDAADRPTDTTVDEEAPTRPTRDPLRGSKTSGAWISVAGLGLVLLLLIIFILQNSAHVEVHYLGFAGSLPLGMALFTSIRRIPPGAIVVSPK